MWELSYRNLSKQTFGVELQKTAGRCTVGCTAKPAFTVQGLCLCYLSCSWQMCLAQFKNNPKPLIMGVLQLCLSKEVTVLLAEDFSSSNLNFWSSKWSLGLLFLFASDTKIRLFSFCWQLLCACKNSVPFPDFCRATSHRPTSRTSVQFWTP